MTRAYIRMIAFVALTGVLAVVIIATLLLLGVAPRVVFMPGFAIKSWCEHLGMHVPNRVGVISTVLLLWAAIIGIRFAVVHSYHLLVRLGAR